MFFRDNTERKIECGNIMTGSVYQFCVGCAHRKDTLKSISCPADFNPYDDEKCPEHVKFMGLENRKRSTDKKTMRTKGFKW